MVGANGSVTSLAFLESVVFENQLMRRKITISLSTLFYREYLKVVLLHH